MSRLLPHVTNLLAGWSVKEVESAICHVQTRYHPLRKVMSSHGPSCDARTGKHMFIDVFKGFSCHLHCYRNVRCQRSWSGTAVLVCLRSQGALKLSVVLVILIGLVLALFGF